MSNKKSVRDAELRAKRIKALKLLDAQFGNLCESHNRRDIGGFNGALDRMLAVVIGLRDPDPNDDKRLALLAALGEASCGTDPADIVVEGSSNHIGPKQSVYVRGDFDIDKLVSCVVWLKPELVIDLNGGEYVEKS